MTHLVLPREWTPVSRAGPFGKYLANPAKSGVWLIQPKNLQNCVQGSVAGPIAMPTSGTHEWRMGPAGQGLSFDNSPFSTNSRMTFPDANGSDGFWHDAKTEVLLFAAVHLELDSNGPLTVFNLGGAGTGIEIAYRNAPDDYIFRLDTTGGDTEIAAATNYTPDSTAFIVARYRGADTSMKMWINGEEEASSSSAAASLPLHIDVPELGGGSSSPVGSPAEWGGLIHLAGIALTYMPDQLCADLSWNLAQMFETPRIIVPVGGSQTHTGTGAAAAQAAVVAGVAEREIPGTGVLAAQASAVSGIGKTARVGTAVLTAQAATIVGAGTVFSTITVPLTIAQSQELKDEEGVLVSSVSNIAWEWYDDPTSTAGSPLATGTLNTNASGEATIQVAGSTLGNGEHGMLLLYHPSNPAIRANLRVQVTA